MAKKPTTEDTDFIDVRAEASDERIYIEKPHPHLLKYNDNVSEEIPYNDHAEEQQYNKSGMRHNPDIKHSVRSVYNDRMEEQRYN